MDSWFLLTLLGSGLIHVGANNTTTGKLPFDKIGTWNRILFYFLIFILIKINKFYLFYLF